MAGLAFLAYAQQKEGIKHVPTPDTDPASGAQMYRTYCAVCHGPDGRDSGPAASALKKPVPDLTQLSKKNRGQFPDFKIANIIQGDYNAPVIVAHGSKDMPMWGDVFDTLKPDESVVKLRIHNLTEYIRSLQEK
jgi:mono/diheme cytochrome c family protein